MESIASLVYKAISRLARVTQRRNPVLKIQKTKPNKQQKSPNLTEIRLFHRLSAGDERCPVHRARLCSPRGPPLPRYRAYSVRLLVLLFLISLLTIVNKVFFSSPPSSPCEQSFKIIFILFCVCVGTVCGYAHARGGLRLSLVFSWIALCVAAQSLNPELTDLANRATLCRWTTRLA